MFDRTPQYKQLVIDSDNTYFGVKYAVNEEKYVGGLVIYLEDKRTRDKQELGIDSKGRTVTWKGKEASPDLLDVASRELAALKSSTMQPIAPSVA